MWKNYINSHKIFTDYKVGKIFFSWDWENCFQENEEGKGKGEKEEGKEGESPIFLMFILNWEKGTKETLKLVSIKNAKCFTKYKKVEEDSEEWLI